MRQIVLRADDLGICEAVNYGIEKSINDGMIRTVGIMPNMTAAIHGYQLIKDKDLCIGQHTNICLGKPCAEPSLIQSLLDKNGHFKSSTEYRAAFKNGKEFVVLEEAVIEIEAQYQRFKEITGKDPDYFEAHAVASKNFFKGLEIVSKKHNLKYASINLNMQEPSEFHDKKVMICPMGSMKEDYDAEVCLKDAVHNARTDMPNIYICHPGYIDNYLLNNSSLTINRTKEVAMLCDQKMYQWMMDQEDVALITYNEI